MININNLSIKNRMQIISNFTYQFETGNIYLIVAVNGSGKTTFFRTLVDLLPKQTGTVDFDGSEFQSAKSHVFYYETSDWFNGNLSGLDYLKFVQKQWDSSIKLNSEIEFWQMQEYIRLPIKKYSLGMKQRLLIALYAVSGAEYLIMDEISNGLDDSSRQLLQQWLKQLKNQGKTILISSHYKEDMLGISDYILTLENKRFTEEIL